MRVAIAGGALQGLEVTYLARKAGHETLLLDRRRHAPAAGLSHDFALLDLEDHGALGRVVESVDMVIPATENVRALRSLVDWCQGAGIPVAFDLEAYAISSSKTASDALFRQMGVPAPTPWPDCPFPVLAKPDGESGSRGVRVFPDGPSMEAHFSGSPPPDWVVQEYLEGPSFSVEVVGRPGAYRPLPVTDLEMDGVYDCKRVMAPSSLSPGLARTFQELAVTLAEGVGLSGIMDVEAILHHGVLKVLEIDARFPSQTPTAVFHATGLNMVDLLIGAFAVDPGEALTSLSSPGGGASILEHIRVRPGRLSVCGEGIMAEAGPLHLEEGFFGAHEALTSYTENHDDWVATLMVRGSDLREARACRERVIEGIRARFGLERYDDESPVGFRSR